jgi:predicted secreted protein
VKRIVAIAAAALMINAVQAQDQDSEDYAVVLPEDAQKCVLPASPDSIPDDASYDDLVAAKKQIAEFQGEVGVFRECLNAADENPDNTPGNKQAIIDSFNYSVEMEERIAERFNAAVRSYKERKAAAEG